MPSSTMLSSSSTTTAHRACPDLRLIEGERVTAMANLFERLAQGRPAPAEEKVKVDPAQKLLDWLQHWSKPTISTRDIHIYGPNSIRDRESAVNSAQTLVD